MKSMTKLMVVAMILVAALVVGPAAARVPALSSTIFIGEENLDVSDFAPGDTRLVHYSSLGDQAVDDEIIVTDGTIIEVKKGIKTGNYYVDGSITEYLNVRSPEVTVDVVLDNSRKDSVVGKSVTRDTVVAFKLANNLVASANATMNIEVTLPGGGVVTQFAGEDLKGVDANGTTLYIPISLAEAAAGKYTVQAKWPKTSDFYGKGFDSNTGAFEVLTKSLAITSDKDSVVRGNSFTVTITGESNKVYYLFIKDANIDIDLYPFIIAGQNGVSSAPGIKGASDVKANVSTTAGGTRSVQFDTNTITKDQSFTIRVQDPTDNATSDEVKVKIEKGSVTITSSGTGTYYIGEEVTLSGTCTDNASTVHLFMTGPNLASSNGVNLVDLEPVVNGDTSSFVTADVKSDDTWSYKWNTGDIAQYQSIDAGGYTIYAVSRPLNKEKLSDAKYATASVQLRSGFITATSSGAIVAKGDDLKLTGTAQGDPDNVRVWIFGKNKQILGESATVEDDGSFEYTLNGADTGNLAAGQYFVVIQHPMMNKEFDIFDNGGWIEGTPVSGFQRVYIKGLQASDAATALINAIDSPNIDDTYVKLTFVVEEAQIWIDAIGDKAAGSKFTITGTTNLAVGDTLNIEVTSAAFKPTTKTEASGFGSVAGTTTVKQGDGANTWSFDVDGSSFKPDQYIVKVECIETDTTATANFNVVEAVPTTQPTATATGTAVTTPTATATTTAAPTQSPGFGALIALAGLGAVAFLVLRRD